MKLLLQVVYFYPTMDLALLREVTSQNPYEYPEKWPSVTENVNVAIRLLRPDNPDIGERTLKEHMTTLLKHHAEENTARLKKQVRFIVFACWKQFMSKSRTVCLMVSLIQHLNNANRLGTDEQYKAKVKLLQGIADQKKDADERARALAASKKTETAARKKQADLRLVAIRASKAGVLLSCQKFIFILVTVCLWGGNIGVHVLQ